MKNFSSDGRNLAEFYDQLKMESYSREQSSAASCARDWDICLLEIVLSGGKCVCGYVWLTGYLCGID